MSVIGSKGDGIYHETISYESFLDLIYTGFLNVFTIEENHNYQDDWYEMRRNNKKNIQSQKINENYINYIKLQNINTYFDNRQKCYNHDIINVDIIKFKYYNSEKDFLTIEYNIHRFRTPANYNLKIPASAWRYKLDAVYIKAQYLTMLKLYNLLSQTNSPDLINKNKIKTKCENDCTINLLVYYNVINNYMSIAEYTNVPDGYATMKIEN